MKKLFVLTFVCLAASKVFAATPVFQFWRATETCTADTNVIVATGPIYLKDISITSGSITGSSFMYSNTTTTVGDVTRTTSTPYMITAVGWLPINETMGKGFNYTKAGTSCIRVTWDWLVNPFPMSTAQRALGVK